MRHAHWLAILTITSLVLLFQNCAQVGPGASSEDPANKSERVIGDASEFDSILFDEQLEIPERYQQQKAGVERLSIDLEAGNMSLGENTSAPKHCNVDTQRLLELRSIVQSARVCEPAPLGDDMVSCMAIGLVDIQLSNKDKTIELRPLVCNSGRFLCDGLDEVFRNLLKDLRANPPVDCQ